MTRGDVILVAISTQTVLMAASGAFTYFFIVKPLVKRYKPVVAAAEDLAKRLENMFK